MMPRPGRLHGRSPVPGLTATADSNASGRRRMPTHDRGPPTRAGERWRTSTNITNMTFNPRIRHQALGPPVPSRHTRSKNAAAPLPLLGAAAPAVRVGLPPNTTVQATDRTRVPDRAPEPADIGGRSALLPSSEGHSSHQPGSTAPGRSLWPGRSSWVPVPRRIVGIVDVVQQRAANRVTSTLQASPRTGYTTCDPTDAPHRHQR